MLDLHVAGPTVTDPSEYYITLGTVKTHIAGLMAKLNARNRVEVAMWAYETNRVGPSHSRSKP